MEAYGGDSEGAQRQHVLASEVVWAVVGCETMTTSRQRLETLAIALSQQGFRRAEAGGHMRTEMIETPPPDASSHWFRVHER